MSNYAGLALSIAKTVGFLMSGINSHYKAKAMLDSLYGTAEITEKSSDKSDLANITKAFEDRVRSRRELRSNFCCHRFV